MGFELPKGLPEGPWTTDDDFTTVLAGDVQICDTWGREQFARAIALIPAMVKEIERAQLLHESDQACIRDCLAHIDRLSELNASMRSALEECDSYFNQYNVQTLADIPAILAKASET